MNIVITAISLHTNAPAGGDTIFVECAKRWISAGHTVTIITTEAGHAFCISHGFPSEHIIVWRLAVFDRFGYALSMCIKTCLAGIYMLGVWSLDADVYFASSFFLPDSIPAAFLALIHKKSRFVTSFYVYTKQFFGVDYSGGRIAGFFFWIHEVWAVWFVRGLDGYVLAFSRHDKNEFARRIRMDSSRVYAVGGGVDSAFFASVPRQKTIYTAVFLGRFHPQKCLDELLRIWSIAHATHPDWKLALIGGGSLEQSLRDIVHVLKLDDVVTFLGVQDGEAKVRMLKSSKICVSASRFDTGNISLDEALACGIPSVIYDLPSMAYHSGVVSVPIGEKQEFVRTMEHIIEDETEYTRLSQGALSYAASIDWSIKAREILEFFSNDTDRVVGPRVP